MRARLAVASVVLVLLAAGCNGGDGGGGASGTVPGDATTTAAGAAEGGETTTTAGNGTGGAAGTTAPELGELVLRQSDFPAGWSSEPAEDDDGEAQAEMERCLGIELSGDRPEATSPRFTVGDAITQASSAVELAPDAATVDREFAAINGPRFVDCAAQQLDRTIARESPGVEFAPAKAERVPFGSFGDGTSAVRVTTAVSAGDQQLPLVADLVFVRKGLAELSFSFINAGEPFAAALATELVGKVVARA